MIARKQRRNGEIVSRYSREGKPLRNYALLVAILNVLVVLAAIGGGRTGRGVDRMSRKELILFSLAVHKLARLLAKDKVTSPFRSPFTAFEHATGAAEVSEIERGNGLRRTVGELISCPYCTSPWAAALFAAGYAASPRIARTYAWVLALTNVSHFLNQLYAKAKELNE